MSERSETMCPPNVAPPECCQPPAIDICPACGSDFTMPTLRPGQTGEVACWVCDHTWSVGKDMEP
jgi:hypothetical protein